MPITRSGIREPTKKFEKKEEAIEMDRPCIAILGIGQMGVSAAACFHRAGFPVLLWARDAKKLASVEESLAQMNRFLDEHFGETPTVPEALRMTTDLTQINAESQFVLECVTEDLEQKATLLAQLSSAADRGAVLTSCTSGLSITSMGVKSGVGRRLVGAHFWNPPHLMPVVEVIRGDQTDDGLVESVSEILREIGKRPVVCKDVPGFIGNRLLHALFREAIHLVEKGICTADDVDLVARMTFGLRLPALGPCENMDLVGLELLDQIQSYLLKDLSAANETMPLIKQMIQHGQLGMKSNRGFYDWTETRKNETIERRNRQIVNQLKFLESQNKSR